jgi:hypothetical protein
VALVIAGAIALGANVNVATAGVLLTFSLVPPLIVFMLWPEAQAATAADVIRGTDRRA